ncbi:MAG: flagellar basal body rod protein FlgB [Nitrospirae bacterium]|nr:flagellar basal body rod protein FlgB [Nitrospirota bacterium]
MPSGLTGSDTFHLLSRVLDLRHAAHERTAENIAHQDTPGFKARHLEFQDALRQAAQGGDPLRPVATRPGHIGQGAGENSFQAVVGTEQVIRHGAKTDGNTVSPEEEMSRLAENTLMYDTASQILANKYRNLRGIIHEGR